MVISLFLLLASYAMRFISAVYIFSQSYFSMWGVQEDTLHAYLNLREQI